MEVCEFLKPIIHYTVILGSSMPHVTNYRCDLPKKTVCKQDYCVKKT